MKYIFLLTLVLLGAIALTGDAPDVSIRDFSGGMNTKDGLFQVKPDQCSDAYNVNFGKTPGAIDKRRGYVGLAKVTSSNILISLYSHYYRNGHKELFGIAKASGKSWGSLYRSGNGRYTLDTSIYNYLYTGARWHWVSWKNNVILSNGRQRPLIWNGNTCRNLIIPAPGEISVAPIDTVAGKGELNGKYTYTVQWQTGLSSYNAISHLSAEVTADHERVILYNFTKTHSDSTDQEDSLIFVILRNCATDTAWESGEVPYYMVFSDTIAKTVWDTMSIIDSIADTTLIKRTAIEVNPKKWAIIGIDSSCAQKVRALGCPNYLGRDTASAARFGKVNPAQLRATQAPNGDTVTVKSVRYMMTYFDTLTQMESDSSRSFGIALKLQDTARYFKIALPPRPAGDTKLRRILYKAFTYKDLRYGGDELKGIKAGRRGGDRKYFISVDTGMTYYYPVEVFTGADTIYTDSITWDTLITRTAYTPASIPANLNNIAAFKDRLWGSDGSKLYYGYLDSIGYWGAFSYYAFNLDDGDEITAVVPDREFINVFKNRNQYVLYPASDGSYSNSQKYISGGIGCVAPFSVAWYDNNLLYLDEGGLFAQTGSIYKDKGSARTSLSDPIANLIDYPISQLKNAVGFVDKDKYFLSFPDKDTTYVYDFKTNSWAIYSYAFQQATHYDTVSNVGLVPSSDMLFITGEDSAIYKADTTLTDKGRQIVMRWVSEPIAPSYNYMGLQDVGLWWNIVPDTGQLILSIIDDGDTAVFTDSLMVSDEKAVKYWRKGCGVNTSNYFKIKLQTDTLNEIMTGIYGKIDSLTINGIDLWYQFKGSVKSR